MAVLDPNSGFNQERMDLLNKYRGGLPLVNPSNPYSSGIANLFSRGVNYADQTGQSPFQKDDINRLAEADYIRNANLYNYNPNAYSLQGLGSDVRNQLGLNNTFYRDRQKSLANLLYDRATGAAPSVAEQSLRAGVEQGQRGLTSALASARPGQSAGSLARALSRGYGQSLANLNQQSAIARLQEQEQNQNALGQLLAQGRQGDVQSGQIGLDAMKANLYGGMNLENQRSNDLMNLYRLNPDALVQTRRQKPGFWSQAKQIGGNIANIAGGLGGAVGGISNIFEKGNSLASYLTGGGGSSYYGPDAASGGDPYGNYLMGAGGRQVEN